MIISELNVSNFRNLSGLHIKNNEPVKFIIGENGVGKSNILEMLNILFNKNSFEESDFNKVDEPIIIEMTMELNEIELGYFDDFFEVENPYKISIIAIQDKPNGRIEFKHKSSDSRIGYQKIKDIPFVYYSSTGAPRSLDFSKSKSAGKFLNEIVNDFILNENINSSDLLKEDQMNLVIDYVNKIIYHIKFIEKSSISVKFEDDILSLLPRLIELKDPNNISINNMGSGVRYSSFIYFEILNKILQAVKVESNAIISDESGKKHLPVIIALDEPEIHLHPFMQRTIISDIRRIINNKDEKFNKLIKNLFGIDYLIGELIVATHSSSIISGNYKEYIRLYLNNGTVKNKSGVLLELEKDEEKHLLAHSYTIKETFFARVALIVEGVTELGAIPVFADKLDCNLDSYSISIIEVGGANSIPIMKKLLEFFGIHCVCIVDRDKLMENPERFEDMFYTKGLEFEADIVETLINNDAVDELKEVIKVIEKDGLSKNIQKSKLENTNKKYKLIDEVKKSYRLEEAFILEDENIKKLILISWLSGFKNPAEGRILAEYISKINIPEVYCMAIMEAKDVSINV
ncbi:MAG: AAA family ATPase [Clostridiales bacterium]|nr:AAA family ATPase [Clostridiales bacterium]